MADRHRETLRALIANVPGVVYRCRPDESRTMLFLSDAIESLSGYPASDFLGDRPVRTFASIMHPDDVGPTIELIRNAVEAGRPYVLEYRVIDAGGDVHWVMGKGRASGDPAGRVLHLDGTMFDITDRKEMEEELRRAKEAAEAATRAKTEFLAQMSHELRSPLNAILGFVDLLIRDPELAEPHREKLGIVGRSGRHLLDMIDQLLGLSRLEAGSIKVRVESFDVVESLEDVVHIARARAAEKGLGFSLELDPGIAPCAEGDAGKIRQVLTNLLANAVRYTSEGGVWLRARTEPQADDPARLTLEVDVADTGPGIPEDQLDRIFERFYRGDQGRDSDSGTGLGLAIARALVEAMGGEIAAASEPGRGSLFKVRIPVRAGDPGSTPSMESDRVVGLMPDQPDRRILVVEDGAENRLLLTTLLREAGFSVREAEDGEAAVKLAWEWQPHLIWMDLRMRVMDGVAATRAIRDGPGGESVKIVAISAGAAVESRSDILEAGFDDLVRKPFRADEIFDAMGRLLGIRYRHAGPRRDSTLTASAALSAAMLTELPPDLLERLRWAALRLDREAMETEIAAIETSAPQTAQALRSLIRRFRLGRILEVLGETGENEEGSVTGSPDRTPAADDEDILLIDDQVESLRLLADILDAAGYRTRPVESPRWAVRSALAHPPALVLLDVRMPEMDGFEVCRRLKENERTRDVPIIFVSGLQDVHERVRGFEAGGVDFLIKPIQEQEVLARVRTHLHLRMMQRGLEHLVRQRTREMESAHEEVRKSEDRFRATFDLAAVGIAHVALDGTYQRVNRMFGDILGYSPEELITRPFEDITHPDDVEDVRRDLRRFEDGEVESISMERRGYRKNRDLVWVSLTVSLRRDEEGAPWYFISTIQDISQQKRTEVRLRALPSQLALAEERERRRIAADLHDHVGQSIALARIQVAMARRNVSGEASTAALDEVSETLLRISGDTSQLIFDLRSPVLDEIGLAAAIQEWLEEQIQRRHGIDVEFVDHAEADAGQGLSDEMRAMLFRNVRELLTNVVKHARARTVRVAMERVDAGLRIAIRDDGVGFDPENASLVHGNAGGFGLFSIRERMGDLGGTFEVDSAPGRGCAAILTVPL